METTRIQNGQTERIEVIALDSSGNPVTGLGNVLLGIRRISDGYWLDFNDGIFKNSGWTTRLVAMTEVDATNDAGKYKYDFNTTGFSDDTYEMRTESAGASNFPQLGELKVGGYVDNIDASINANETKIDALQSDITDIRRIVRNKLTINDSSNKLELWNDVGDAVILEWDLTDKDGTGIVLQGTGPANRGAPTTP